jgi:hypothetical protein
MEGSRAGCTKVDGLRETLFFHTTSHKPRSASLSLVSLTTRFGFFSPPSRGRGH